MTLRNPDGTFAKKPASPVLPPRVMSADARAILDFYNARCVHVGEAAERLAEEVSILLDRVDEAERRIDATECRLRAARSAVSSGFVRAKPMKVSVPKIGPEPL